MLDLAGPLQEDLTQADQELCAKRLVRVAVPPRGPIERLQIGGA